MFKYVMIKIIFNHDPMGFFGRKIFGGRGYGYMAIGQVVLKKQTD